MIKRKIARAMAGIGPYRDDREAMRQENERLRRVVEMGVTAWLEQRIASVWNRLYWETYWAWERAMKMVLWVVTGAVLSTVGFTLALSLCCMAQKYGSNMHCWFLRMRPPGAQFFLSGAGSTDRSMPEAVRVAWLDRDEARIVLRSPWLMGLPVERRMWVVEAPPCAARFVFPAPKGLVPPKDLEYVDLPLVGWTTLVPSVTVEVVVGPADLQQEYGDDG